ncbi:hypothetical protein ACFRFU_46730 [Streptomyces sp. NPDC056704]|uniref:hypothetical protein n=1 Tax=Streptomyces sp. NPDC056704 TaxID=3345917 RepID=UPI0036788496
MAIAHPVPFLERGEEDVGATVVGVVDALHPAVSDEDSRHLVVGSVSEQLVDAATPPGSAGGEKVAVRAELRVRIVLYQQTLPIPRNGLEWRNLGFGRPERSDHIHVRTSEQLIEDGVVMLQDNGVLALVLRVPL